MPRLEIMSGIAALYLMHENSIGCKGENRLRDSVTAAGQTGSRGFQTCLRSGLVPYVNGLLNTFHKRLSRKELEHTSVLPGLSALRAPESCSLLFLSPPD